MRQFLLKTLILLSILVFGYFILTTCDSKLPLIPPPPGKHKLHFISIVCDEPATSFGDDIEIFANGRSLGGQFPIDQGQSHDLNGYSIDFNNHITVEFKEDSDPAGQIVIGNDLSSKGTQREYITIKDDGRYQFFFEVLEN